MFAYDTVAASSMLSGFVAVIVSRPCYLSASVRPVCSMSGKFTLM